MSLENGARPQELSAAESDMEEAASLVPQLEQEYKRLKQLYEAGIFQLRNSSWLSRSFWRQSGRLKKFKSNLDMLVKGHARNGSRWHELP